MRNPEVIGISLVNISRKITPTQTTLTFASVYIDDDLRRVIQAAFSQSHGTSSIQSEIMHLKHAGNIIHVPRLLVKWVATWDHPFVTPPPFQEPGVREGPKPPDSPVNPLTL